MESSNDKDKFGNALDNYEKALAKKDWVSAVEFSKEAIDCNPYPIFYGDLSRRLEGAQLGLEESTRKLTVWQKLFPKKNTTGIAYN